MIVRENVYVKKDMDEVKNIAKKISDKITEIPMNIIPFDHYPYFPCNDQTVSLFYKKDETGGRCDGIFETHITLVTGEWDRKEINVFIPELGYEDGKTFETNEISKISKYIKSSISFLKMMEKLKGN